MYIFPSICISYTSDNPVTYHGPLWITRDYVQSSKPTSHDCWRRKKYITLPLIFSIGLKKFGANARMQRHTHPSLYADLHIGNYSI